MAETYVWDCKCGATGSGEKAAMDHAKVCHVFGAPWTNPAWPRPEGTVNVKRGSNHLPSTGRCHACKRAITGERRYCGPCLARR